MAVEAAQRAGISWGFRIMQASPSNPREHLLPDFLADRLPMYPYYDGEVYGPSPRKLPLYTEEYLKYWEEMLMLLGEKYDGMPSLEYADVSGFGLWGEGHHGCRPTPDGPVVDLELGSRERMEEVVRRLIDSHQRAFPLTPMVLNLVLSEYRAGAQAIQNGCWVRRDSYYRWFQADHMMPQLFEPFCRRLGYRLRPSIIWKQRKADGSGSLVLGMVNDGCANPPGNLYFQAESGGKTSGVQVNGGNLGERMCLVELPLPEDCTNEVRLRLFLETGKKRRPVRFAADVREAEAPLVLTVRLEHP